jgi:hypothetical protein
MLRGEKLRVSASADLDILLVGSKPVPDNPLHDFSKRWCVDADEAAQLKELEGRKRDGGSIGRFSRATLPVSSSWRLVVHKLMLYSINLTRESTRVGARCGQNHESLDRRKDLWREGSLKVR